MTRAIRLFFFLIIPALVALPSSPCSAGAKVEKISLQTTVAYALKNNFEIELVQLESNMADEDTALALSEFDPVLDAQVSTARARNPGASVFANPEITETNSVGAQVSVSRKTSIGGQYKAGVEVDRSQTNSTFQSIDPSYSTALQLEADQPLLRNAGKRVNIWKIVVNTNKQAISLENLRAKLNDIVTRTIETYWEFVFLVAELKVQEESLERARDLVRKVQAQVSAGLSAPLDVTQAQASVASREELVIQAQGNVEQVSERLLRLMNPPDRSRLWKNLMAPTDSPDMEHKTPDMEKSVARALENRPEIRVAKKEMENSNVKLVYFKNQKLPSLDLVATLKLNGLRGRARPVVDLNTGQTLFSRLDGEIGDSVSDAASGEYYDYTIGLKFTYPFGNRGPNSRYARAGLDLRRTAVKLKQMERDIMFEVRDALRRMRTSEKKIASAKSARGLAEKKLSAEINRFQVGASTPFTILEYQKDLAVEKSREIRASVDYRKAVSAYNKALGIALESVGFSFKTAR